MHHIENGGDGQEHISDEMLVHELQVHHGDHSDAENRATRLMMQRCKPEIDSVLHAMGVRWSDMDDGEQMVFIRVLQNIDQLRDPKKFHSWVRMIANRAALTMRRERRHKGMPAMSDVIHDEDASLIEPVDDPEDRPIGQILGRESQQQLLRNIASMDDTSRRRLQQFYLRGMSVQEIHADHAEGEDPVPIGTIKRQLHTARQRLYEKMGPYMDTGNTI